MTRKTSPRDALDYPSISDDLWVIWSSNGKPWPDANRRLSYLGKGRDTMRDYALFTFSAAHAETFSDEASARAFLVDDAAKRPAALDVNISTVADLKERCGFVPASPPMTPNQQAAQEFAAKVKAWGFRVWIAERGTYGFISDEAGTRVLGFSADGPWSSLGGNYGPPSSESGTGWKMEETLGDMKTAEDVRRALYAYPPSWCGKGWRTLTTVEQHLKTYGTSSRYSEV